MEGRGGMLGRGKAAASRRTPKSGTAKAPPFADGAKDGAPGPYDTRPGRCDNLPRPDCCPGCKKRTEGHGATFKPSEPPEIPICTGPTFRTRRERWGRPARIRAGEQSQSARLKGEAAATKAGKTHEGTGLRITAGVMPPRDGHGPDYCPGRGSAVPQRLVRRARSEVRLRRVWRRGGCGRTRWRFPVRRRRGDRSGRRSAI